MNKKELFYSLFIAFGISLIVGMTGLIVGESIPSSKSGFDLSGFLMSFHAHPLRIMVPAWYLTYKIRTNTYTHSNILIAFLIMFIVDALMAVNRMNLN